MNISFLSEKLKYIRIKIGFQIRAMENKISTEKKLLK